MGRLPRSKVSEYLKQLQLSERASCMWQHHFVRRSIWALKSPTILMASHFLSRWPWFSRLPLRSTGQFAFEFKANPEEVPLRFPKNANFRFFRFGKPYDTTMFIHGIGYHDDAGSLSFGSECWTDGEFTLTMKPKFLGNGIFRYLFVTED